VADRASEWRILREVAIALVLGGVIGFEREAANKPAGFRTHMLVAGAAALLGGIGFTLVERPWSGSVRADPIRILQAIIIGVSFLGAGTIVRGKHPEQVHGLTTAASLLMSSGIGIAVALNQMVLAFGVAVLVSVVLHVLGRFEARVIHRDE
jgi:putative Mg2+ transporter-C (MgtC) family protein